MPADFKRASYIGLNKISDRNIRNDKMENYVVVPDVNETCRTNNDCRRASKRSITFSELHQSMEDPPTIGIGFVQKLLSFLLGNLSKLPDHLQ